jgi:hypothetical protein
MKRFILSLPRYGVPPAQVKAPAPAQAIARSDGRQRARASSIMGLVRPETGSDRR